MFTIPLMKEPIRFIDTERQRMEGCVMYCSRAFFDERLSFNGKLCELCNKFTGD